MPTLSTLSRSQSLSNLQTQSKKPATQSTDLESGISLQDSAFKTVSSSSASKIDPTATIVMRHQLQRQAASNQAMGDGVEDCGACFGVTFLVPAALSGIYAAAGATTGATGAAILNKFGLKQFSNLVGTAAKQGAVGGAVLGGSLGTLFSCCFAAGQALGNNGEAGGGASGGIVSGLILSIASNALGNAILTSAEKGHTTQLEGLEASAAGTATIAVASSALACVLFCCCAGFMSGAALRDR